jgi:hypothetical protein
VRALVTSIGGIVVALIGLMAARAGRRGRRSDRPTSLEEQLFPDLISAATARVRALETDGPARSERIDQSRADLETIAAKFHKKKQEISASWSRARKLHEPAGGG